MNEPQIERELFLRFQIDTNRINSRGKLQHMNRLEAWHRAGLIELLIGEPAFAETASDRDALRRRKGMSYIQTSTHADTPDEGSMLKQIERVIFPSGVASDNDRADVEIVFNAFKYSAYLVTADGGSKRQPGGILGAAAALRSLDIKVITDEQACAVVENAIKNRDALAQQWATHTGKPPPTWLGKDL